MIPEWFHTHPHNNTTRNFTLLPSEDISISITNSQSDTVIMSLSNCALWGYRRNM